MGGHNAEASTAGWPRRPCPFSLAYMAPSLELTTHLESPGIGATSSKVRGGTTGRVRKELKEASTNKEAEAARRWVMRAREAEAETSG